MSETVPRYIQGISTIGNMQGRELYDRKYSVEIYKYPT